MTHTEAESLPIFTGLISESRFLHRAKKKLPFHLQCETVPMSKNHSFKPLAAGDPVPRVQHQAGKRDNFGGLLGE